VEQRLGGFHDPRTGIVRFCSDPRVHWTNRYSLKNE
jgi:hypothetical protein